MAIPGEKNMGRPTSQDAISLKAETNDSPGPTGGTPVMKKLATRAAVIATVAFSIFLGGGGLGPSDAEARYAHYCPGGSPFPGCIDPDRNN